MNQLLLMNMSTQWKYFSPTSLVRIRLYYGITESNGKARCCELRGALLDPVLHLGL
jgi:hypothetical protein